MKTHPGSIFVPSSDISEALADNDTYFIAAVSFEAIVSNDVEFVPAEAYAELKERLATAEFPANAFESLYDGVYQELEQLKARVNKAMDIIGQFGGIDGDHHRAWVIDQAVRALTGDGYTEWVKMMNDGEDGPDTYEWDEGIAP
jgi:hypothetical protein